MCPLCIGTAWLIAGGVSSAGGVATVAWRSVSKRRRRSSVRRVAPPVETVERGKSRDSEVALSREASGP